jgi:hypothetical protein
VSSLICSSCLCSITMQTTVSFSSFCTYLPTTQTLPWWNAFFPSFFSTVNFQELQILHYSLWKKMHGIFEEISIVLQSLRVSICSKTHHPTHLDYRGLAQSS